MFDFVYYSNTDCVKHTSSRFCSFVIFVTFLPAVKKKEEESCSKLLSDGEFSACTVLTLSPEINVPGRVPNHRAQRCV